MTAIRQPLPLLSKMENKRHVNVESDFKIIFTFSGENIPTYPWRLELSTPKTEAFNIYTVCFDGNRYHKCLPIDNRSILVLVNAHHLQAGCLSYKLKPQIPDALFPDGKMDITIPGCSGIELWDGPSDEYELPDDIEVVLSAMLKGYSPSIKVEENTDSSYILRIINETDSYLTPNLRASINLVQEIGDNDNVAMSQSATTRALKSKVDKEEGKGLSSNDYTDDDKEKLDGLSNYDDTEVRAQLSEKASKEEVADAAQKTLSAANSHTDERIEETKSEIATGLIEFGGEVGKAISDGDANTLESAQKYTDDAIDAIPTPDVSGQIEQHNTSPTAHPNIREILNTCVGLPEFNGETYELTFTTIAGAKLIVDLPIEQMGLEYNKETGAIEFVNADGSISSIPVSDFVKVYAGSIGPEIQITVDGSEIRATLLNNTVSWDKITLDLQEVIEGKADRTEIPTKVSELENDSEFVTAEEIDPELRKTSFEVVAHSDCTLEERVAHLESLLVRMLSGDVLIPELQVKKLGVWGGNNIVVTGDGAPAKAPDRAGQFYIDTKNNAVYHSVGNNAVSNWKNN